MKTIGFLIGYYPLNRGGAEYQSYYIANYLKSIGYKVFFISVGKNEGKKGIIFDNGIKIYLLTPLSLPIISNIYFSVYNRIKKIVKIEKPDIVYQRSGDTLTTINYILSKKYNYKSIWHISHMNNVLKKIKLNKYYFVKALQKMILNYGIKYSNIVIAQAKYQQDLLYNNYRRKCDLVILNVHPLSEKAIYKSYPVKIMWVANLKQWKQPEKFLHLVEKLSYTKAKFIMIGRDPKNKWSHELKNRIKHINNLKYLGEQPIKKVNEMLAESHIFVNTSLYEGFPNTFIQAWMRKVPVVSLNVDPDDILKNNRIGFHSGNMEQLIEDVKKLIDNKDLRNNYGNRAKDYAFKNHSIKNIEKLVELIEYGA